MNKVQDNETAFLTPGEVVSEDVVVWDVREEREHCLLGAGFLLPDLEQREIWNLVLVRLGRIFTQY